MSNPTPELHPENLTPGNPGNRGGGRPSSAVRAACREGFAQAVPKIIEIATGEAKEGEDGASPGERVRAFEALGKFGLGEMKAIVEEEMLKAVATVLSRHVPPEKLEPIVDELIAELRASA